MHGDPDGLRETAEHIQEIITERRPKLIEYINSELRDLGIAALELRYALKLNEEEVLEVKNEINEYLQAQIRAKQVPDTYQALDLKQIKEGLDGEELLKELEEREKEYLTTAFKRNMDAQQRYNMVLGALQQLQINETLVGAELIEAIKQDYDFLGQQITPVLEAAHKLAQDSEELTKEADKLQDNQRKIERSIDEEQEREKRIEHDREKTNKERHEPNPAPG